MWRIWTAVVLWGLNWPAVKIVLAHAGPWTLRFAGIACGGAILMVLARAMGQSLVIPRRDWWGMAGSCLFTVTGFNILAVFAQTALPTSRATILAFTMPLWSALLGWMLLGERIDALRTLALAIGMAGLALLSQPFWPEFAAGVVPVGLVYALGAAVAWACGTVWLRRFPVTSPPVAATAWQVVFAAVICGGCLLAFETPRLDLTASDALLAFAYHAVFPQAIAYVLWFSLVAKVPVATSSIGSMLTPVVAAVGSVALLREWPTVSDLTGLALLIAAVALDQLGRAAQARTPAA